MRRLLAFFILTILCFGGYYYYQHFFARGRSLGSGEQPGINLSQSPLDFKTLTNVLGSATSRVVRTGEEILNNGNEEGEEPLVNQTLDNLREELRRLPQQQYDKVKYEFCKDVVTNYEERE